MSEPVDWQKHLEQDFFRWLWGMEDERERAEACVSFLEPEHFTVSTHSALFALCKRIIDDGAWPSMHELFGRLRDHEQLRRCGGDELIVDLFGSLPTGFLPNDCCYGIEHIMRWLLRTHEERRQERIIVNAQTALHVGRSDELAAILDELWVDSDNAENEHTARDLLEYEFTKLVSRDVGEVDRVLTTGLGAIDHVVGNWAPGNLYFIAGETGAGKSSVMLALLDGFARRGIRAGLISLEDSVDTLGPRVASIVADVPQNIMSRAEYASDEERAYVLVKLNDRARDPHVRSEFLIVHQDAALGDVKRYMKRLVRRHKCSVVFVDYIQAVRSKVRATDRRHELATMAASIKAQAGLLGVPVIVGSQLRRLKPGERPGKRDLRDCGELEEKAEGVLIAWERKQNDRVLVVAKVKNGRAGHLLRIHWDPSTACVRGFYDEEEPLFGKAATA